MNSKVLALACLSISASSANAAIIQAYGSGNETFYSFDSNTADLTLLRSLGGYAMDFSPAGTLYGVDRYSDAVYRISKTGGRTLLASVGYDDTGGGFTVSNDGQYAYWTNRTDFGTGSGYPTQLYRMQLSGGAVQSLGLIDGLFSVSDIEFGLDGTLYAISGMSHGACSAPDRALYTIDLNAMTSTKISENYLGMSVGCSTIVGSLNATADGAMHMLVKPDGSRSYYMGTIDLSNGRGSIDYSRAVTLDGGAYTEGIDVAYMSTVPLPEAAWLFGSGLLGLVGTARRKKVAESL